MKIKRQEVVKCQWNLLLLLTMKRRQPVPVTKLFVNVFIILCILFCGISSSYTLQVSNIGNKLNQMNVRKNGNNSLLNSSVQLNQHKQHKIIVFDQNSSIINNLTGVDENFVHNLSFQSIQSDKRSRIHDDFIETSLPDKKLNRMKHFLQLNVTSNSSVNGVTDTLRTKRQVNETVNKYQLHSQSEESKKKYEYRISDQLLQVDKFVASSTKRVPASVSIVSERKSTSNSRERRDDEGQSSYIDREVNYYSTRSPLQWNNVNHVPKSLSLSATSSDSGCPNWHLSSSTLISSSSSTTDVLKSARYKDVHSTVTLNTGHSSSRRPSEPQLVQNDDSSSSVSAVNCSCYDFDDGLFIECPNTNVNTIRASIESLRLHNLQSTTTTTTSSDTKVSPVTIKSYTIYNMDTNVHQLPGKLFSSIKQMQKIRISDTQITQISDDTFDGIESQLESLSISSSKLTHVPQKALSTLKSLDTLDLDSNEITEINAYSFYGLPLLSLNLQYNKINNLQEYSFGGLENSLQELSLIGNKLTIFPLSAIRRLKNLRTLKLNENKISIITGDEYTRFIQMNNLDLRSNIISHLTDVSFITMPNLVSLSLSSNKISTIDDKVFSHLINLESLDLSKNYLRLLNGVIFSSLLKLRSIDLSNNHIHYIEMGTFHNLPQLRELFLTKNNLRSLLNGTFYNTTQIRSLFIEHNSLESIDSGVFYNCNHLYQLHLSYNQLTEISVNLFKFNQELRSLSLDNNLLRSIQPGTFDNLIELRDLRLHRNNLYQITNYYFKSILNLQELHLQYNQIISIDDESFISLINLEYLDVSNNLLKILSSNIFNKFPSNFKYLSVNNNQITRINDKLFDTLNQLEIIQLNYNNLTRITRTLFNNLTTVEKLYLNNNLISRIDIGSFIHCINLRQLCLQNNLLEYIDSSTFKGLSSLEVLDLSNNPIKSLDGAIFIPISVSIRSINLNSCNLHEIKRNWFFSNDFMETMTSEEKYLTFESIDLSNNSIETIEPFSLASLTSLRSIYLSNNQLTTSSLKRSSREGSELIKRLITISLEREEDILKMMRLNEIDDSSTIDYQRLNCTPREYQVSRGLSVNTLFPRQVENLFLSGNNLSGLELTQVMHDVSSSSSSSSLSGESNWRMSIEATNENIFHHLNSLDQLDLSYTSIESASFFTSPSSSNDVFTSRCIDVSKSNKQINLSPDVTTLQDDLTWINIRVINFSGNGVKFIASSAIPLNIYNNSGNNLQSDHSSEASFNTMKSLSSHVTELNLNDNQLTSVPGSDVLKYHEHLQYISLSGNNIKRIPGGSFKYNNQLRTIDLSNNSLSVMDIASFEGLNESLETLNLSHNVMRFIPSNVLDGLYNLQTLIFDNNWFPFLPNTLIRLTNLPNLKLLSIKNNPLTRIREDTSEVYRSSIENVTILTFEGDNLTVIASHDLTPFINLKELILRNNQILKISPGSFRSLKLLQLLDLSLNKLELLPEERLSTLNNLRYLNLSYNQLSEMPSFSPDLKLINILDVSNNRLTRIETLSHLSSSIEEIYLQDNMIAWISGSSLTNLTSLRKLDIRSNFLTHLPESLLTPIEVSLEQLYLIGNPFHCDCRLLSLWEWVQEHPRILPQKDRDTDLICVQSDKVTSIDQMISNDRTASQLIKVDSSKQQQQQQQGNSIIISTLHPVDFCPVPLISRVEVTSIESTSLTLQWFVQNDSLVGGFKLDSYMSNDHRNSQSQRLPSTDRLTMLSNLHPETEYTICIEANGKYIRSSEMSSSSASTSSISPSDSNNNRASSSYVFGLHRAYGDNYITSNRKCVQSRTHTEVGNKQMIIFFNRISLTGLLMVSCGILFILATGIVTVSLLIKWKSMRESRRIKQQSIDLDSQCTLNVSQLSSQQQQQIQGHQSDHHHHHHHHHSLDTHDLLHTSASIHSQLHQHQLNASTVATATILPETLTMSTDDYLIDQIDSMPLPLPIQSQIPEEFITYRHFALPTHECMYNNGWTGNTVTSTVATVPAPSITTATLTHTGLCEHVTQID